ncbi:MAG: hypothetical protein ACT4QF_14165 [Sporichthyaceae bacterium]
MLIADLEHFLDLPEQAPAPARRLAEQLGRLVRAATAGPVGATWTSAVGCSRRPGNRPCPGRVRVTRSTPEAPVQWRCNGCDDEGVISNWEDSPFDLRRGRPVPVERTTAIPLDRQAVTALQSMLLLDPDPERVVFAARVEPDGAIVLSATDDELDALLDGVAAEANPERNRRRRALLDAAYAALADAERG